MRRALLLLMTLAPTVAHAEMDEWQLAVGADYRSLILTGDPDDLTIHVPGVDLGLWYGIDDYWQLGGSLQAGVALPDGGDAGALGSVALEVRYILDIVEWVPHFTVGVGALGSSVGERVDLIAGIGGGLDYRSSRELSVGVDFRYDFVLTDFDAVTATFHAGLVVSVHFE